MTCAEILVILVERDLEEFRISLGCQREYLLFAVKRVKAGNKLNESVFL